MHNKGIYERFVKRPQDLLCSLLALIVLSPLFIILVMLVQIKMGSPVLFTQDRPGKDGKIFKLYKFRTMTDQRDENGKLLADEQRLTKFGRFLRSTSLDELPALINILRGDMAVIGPRPLLASYLERYDEHQARRHEVRPGLTGLAQISGRNALSWEDRFNLDVEYVDNISFLKDWKIIFKTVEIVLKKEGINSSTSSTMEEFKGSNKS